MRGWEAPKIIKMTEQESLQQPSSLSEWEQREDRLYNNRMLVVMNEIEHDEYVEWIKENCE